jgi:LacI family transcriptional regulator
MTEQDIKGGPRLPTLHDIAEKAGVSRAAVSAVLNNAPQSQRYSEATRKRVRQVADELGYMANPLGRVLRKKRSGIIGCLTFNQPDIYYGHLLRSAEQVFREHGFEPVTVSMNYDRSRFHEALKKLAVWRVEGLLIMLGGRPVNHGMKKSLGHLATPYFIIDSSASGNRPPSSAMNMKSGRLLASHLLELGHTKMAAVGINPENSHTRERLSGILEILAEAGIPEKEFIVSRMRNGLFGAHAGYVYIEELLAMEREFTAVICANDLLAFGVMRYLHEQNIRIPQDISVAGFDDVCVDVTVTEENHLGAYFTPSLTTIRIPHGEIGISAAEILLSHIEKGVKQEDMQMRNDLLLVVRESTGKPPTRSVFQLESHLNQSVED